MEFRRSTIMANRSFLSIFLIGLVFISLFQSYELMLFYFVVLLWIYHNQILSNFIQSIVIDCRKNEFVVQQRKANEIMTNRYDLNLIKVSFEMKIGGKGVKMRKCVFSYNGVEIFELLPGISGWGILELNKIVEVTSGNGCVNKNSV